MVDALVATFDPALDAYEVAPSSSTACRYCSAPPHAGAFAALADSSLPGRYVSALSDAKSSLRRGHSSDRVLSDVNRPTSATTPELKMNELDPIAPTPGYLIPFIALGNDNWAER